MLDETGSSYRRHYYFEADSYRDGDLIIGKDHRSGAPGSTTFSHSSYSIQRLSPTSLRFIHSHAGAIDPLTLTVIEVPTGAKGSAGIAGAAGATGPTGPAGAAGSDGADGDDGSDGATGAAGATGPQGPAGSAGADGADGSTGPQGSAGTDGTDGAQGPAGATGAAGSDGSDGATGSQGPTGTAGADGATGAQGAHGIYTAEIFRADAATPGTPSGGSIVVSTGVVMAPIGWFNSDNIPTPGTGESLYAARDTINPNTQSGTITPSWSTVYEAGGTGPAGPAGADGAAGATGDDGMDGAAGATGATGTTGATGAAGTAGADGADGMDGSQGPKGDQGDQGAAGTAGADGMDGADGSTGAAGAAGADGADGATGATGPTGADGADGADGSIQQGTKAELGAATFATATNGGSNDVTLSRDPAAGTTCVIVLDETGSSFKRHYYFESDSYREGDLIIGKDHRSGAPGSTAFAHSSYSIQRQSATVLRFVHSHASTIDPFALAVLEIPTGAKGDQGTAGAAGADGAAGATGDDGDDGDDGAAGAPGATGPAGAAGAAGATGPAGADGTDGTDGAAGAQGPAGADGATGPAGATGETGADGDDGADGATGAQGNAGSDGATGSQGPAGADGDDGTDGEQGEQGEQGIQGPEGPVGSITSVAPNGTNVTLPTDYADYQWLYIEAISGSQRRANTTTTEELAANATLSYRVGGSSMLAWDRATRILAGTGLTSIEQVSLHNSGGAGPRGEQGDQGSAGADGADGADGATIADTDALSEGSSNLYYTNSRADARIADAAKEGNTARWGAAKVPSDTIYNETGGGGDTVTNLWFGTEAEFQALTADGNTVYFRS